MISVELKKKGVTFFVDKAENPQESARLKNLARETRYYSQNFDKTGLFVALECVHDGQDVLVLTVRKPARLTKEEYLSLELERIKQERLINERKA